MMDDIYSNAVDVVDNLGEDFDKMAAIARKLESAEFWCVGKASIIEPKLASGKMLAKKRREIREEMARKNIQSGEIRDYLREKMVLCVLCPSCRRMVRRDWIAGFTRCKKCRERAWVELLKEVKNEN